jgi:tetratricopeptide (TPR) repeat protein
MTSLSGSIRSAFLVILIFGSIVIFHPHQYALAQENPAYTLEEYNGYQAITGESDPAKKMDLITQFFKTYPKSTLKPNITSDFQETMKNLRDAKKWSQVITLGKQYLSFVPDDAYTVAMVAEGYSETKNFQQFVIFGDATYKTSPSGNLAYAMAKAYKELGNNEKFLEWGTKTVAAFPDNYEIMLEMAIIYADNQRTAEADRYAKQCLKVIQAAKKPEQMAEKDWGDYTRRAFQACYLIIGSSAFQRQDFTAAIPNLENSLKYNSRNDMAYYWLGQCYWQARNTVMAMKNFAKANLLGGRAAVPAKQQLENLYKQTHKNSLVGLDRVIAAAKAELEQK